MEETSGYDSPVSLWTAFRWSGPLVMGAVLACFLNPVIIFFGARRWGWPQYLLKVVSILPLANTVPLSFHYLRIIHQVIYGQGGIDSQYAALGAIGEVRLLLYVGSASAFLSLIVSCVRPRLVSPPA